MKEAYLYKKLSDNEVQCQNCAHYCIVEAGKRGICQVRENQNGVLYSLNYGKVIALNIDPIEKKPFFHFLPGSKSLSIATVGCNFACFSCQNYQISQGPKIVRGKIWGEDLSPEDLVKEAKKNNCPSVSYTYTEPTIFLEYALDTMKLAKKEGLKNNWITNGFMSREALELVAPYLDAANIDLKSFDDKFYQKYCDGKLQPVLNTLERMKKKNIWLEVTTLVIPTLNDSEEIFRKIAKFIKEKLGPETPWHITQFSGAISWKLQNIPDTSAETLKIAYQIGKKIGLKYVYTGNIPGLENENTYCPKCQAKMLSRTGYFIERQDKNGKCSECGENLNIIE